ncbi:MAG: M18 family aminopeptidase [Lachnospiraceae bacterium]|nr:M18 family aminopeptidase [Lachnospiraceae bacterium]
MTSELKKMIEQSVSPFHTIDTVKKILAEHNFKELKSSGDFELKPMGKYYVDLYDSSLIAFTVGNNSRGRVRLTASHTDFPCFKIKPNAVILAENNSTGGYVKINTEVYGGPILNTWLDRPLSVAGRLLIKGCDKTNPFDNQMVLVDAKKPVLIIPNLAIHMNREVNKGVELNRQKDLLPITALLNGNSEASKDVIELLFEDTLQELKITREDVLDYELYVYNLDEGKVVGIDESMYSSPRLDNLTSVFAQTNAIINATMEEGLNIAMYFDHEEIGSRTKQGAASEISLLIMEKIYAALGRNRNDLINDLLDGMMLSIDVAHAIHPNYPEKTDPTNHVMLNKGMVIKIAASQSYSNDAVGIAAISRICNENGIEYQKFVNKSDMAGGQTLGAISSTILPVRTIDIGIPLLSMHSSRELMGVKDEKNLEKFLTVYYS